MSGNWFVILVMIAGGSVLGYYVASRVQMTEMPQLVAALHSFVGLAAVFIGYNAELELGRVAGMDEAARHALTGFAAVLAHKLADPSGALVAILKVEVFLGVFIGAVTFTRLRRRLRQAGRQGRRQGQEATGRAHAQRQCGGRFADPAGDVFQRRRHLGPSS